MKTFGNSQSMKRVEDVRFLKGEGQNVDDIAPTGSLCGCVLWSSFAHGEITAPDVRGVRDADGVHLVLTAVSNVVQDAVWDVGLRDVQIPFTPHPVWPMIQEA